MVKSVGVRGGGATGSLSEDLPDLAGSVTATMPPPLAGRKRPDMQALVRRTPAGARVVVGGPPALVRGLDLALEQTGRLPSTCLTHTMCILRMGVRHAARRLLSVR